MVTVSDTVHFITASFTDNVHTVTTEVSQIWFPVLIKEDRVSDWACNLVSCNSYEGKSSPPAVLGTRRIDSNRVVDVYDGELDSAVCNVVFLSTSIKVFSDNPV